MRQGLVVLSVFIFAGCQTTPSREPASFDPSYDSRKVRLLQLAATSGILINIQDAVLRDPPKAEINESCRGTLAETWSVALFRALEVLQKRPELATRIHFIELKRGSSASATISRDLDGAVRLVLSQAKIERRSTISAETLIPCNESASSFLGSVMSETSYEWPDHSSIEKALEGLPERPIVDRASFNSGFLQYLANRQTILRVSPDMLFERASSGQPTLARLIDQLSEEITKSNYKNLDYILHLISKNSEAGKEVRFFGFIRDQNKTTGIHVESKGRFQRQINMQTEITYPFISYHYNGNINHSTLDKLEECLILARGAIQRSSLDSQLENNPKSYLYPGYSCR